MSNRYTPELEDGFQFTAFPAACAALGSAGLMNIWKNPSSTEDKVSVRFWQGRFKCQLLRDERALLAAMTYVDLNPIHVNMAPGLNRSKFTTVRKRHRAVLKQPELANQPLVAMTGVNS